MENTPLEPSSSYGTMNTNTHPFNENVRDCVKQRIIAELIEPTYYRDIQSSLGSRRRWKIAGHIFETASKVLIAASGILSFASGYYSNLSLGFSAGSTSTISLACLQFASYCFRESKTNAEEANILLQSIKIDTVPELAESVDENLKVAEHVSENPKSIDLKEPVPDIENSKIN